MKLYTFYTPNSLKIELALAELGLDCEREKVALAKGEHMTDDFKKVNPHQKIPVLEVDGVAIAESGAILQYLGQSNPGPLWPSDPLEAAQLSRWMFFEGVHLASVCSSIWWSDTLSPRRGVPASSDAANAYAEEVLVRHLDMLNEVLASREFIGGNDFSLADCALGPTLCLLKDTRLDPSEKWPNVASYTARIRARDSWTQALGDRRMHWSD